MVDKADESIGPFGLVLDSEMMGVQRRDKGRQPGIAQPLVIRSPLREADGVARPRPDCNTHVPSQVRKDTGLQIRGTGLRGEAPAQHRQCSQRHHPTEHSYNKPEEAALRTRIGPPPPIALQQTMDTASTMESLSCCALGWWNKRRNRPEQSVRGLVAFGVRDVSALSGARGRVQL
jgi:hypothetical protein